jgi:hypothetical protein
VLKAFLFGVEGERKVGIECINMENICSQGRFLQTRKNGNNSI